MALDNPVSPIGSRGLGRGSRVLELAVVIGLTVAVVVVAAQWDGPSTAPDGQAVGAVEPAATLPTGASTEAEAKPTTQAAAASNAGPIAVEALAVAATVEARPPAPVDLVQTGVVPGRPDPLDPVIPNSFERYQVQRGESLFSIASARGVSVADLARWNWHLREDSVLIRGEWIWIPGWDVSIVADESRPPMDEGKSGRGGG